MKLPTKKEIRDNIVMYSGDAEYLHLISEQELDELVEEQGGNMDSDIFFHWYNGQEELRDLAAEMLDDMRYRRQKVEL